MIWWLGLLFVFYVLGVVASYHIFKKSHLKQFNWTRGDKRFYTFISLFFPFNCVAAILALGDIIGKGDKILEYRHKKE